MADAGTEPAQAHALPINPPIYNTHKRGPNGGQTGGPRLASIIWWAIATEVIAALSHIGEHTRRPRTYLLE
eukprot:7749506-Prorocentrum_lima.AAC.1